MTNHYGFFHFKNIRWLEHAIWGFFYLYSLNYSTEFDIMRLARWMDGKKEGKEKETDRNRAL